MSDKKVTNDDAAPGKKNVWGAVARVTLWTLGGLILLIVVILCAATWMLTPERLTRLVNREMSRELAADVSAHNVRYTFWSTFPHLHIELDSIRIMSRALDSVPAAMRSKLPADARFLLSTGHFEGGINISSLFGHRYVLHDVRADSVTLNLVKVSDKVANWDIIPSSKSEGIPYFTFNTVSLTRPRPIRYTDLSSGVGVTVNLNKMALRRKGKSDDYNVSIRGLADISIDQRTFLDDFPFALDGDVSLKFKPFRFKTDDYKVALGNTVGKVNLEMEFNKGPRLNVFNYKLDSFDLSNLLRMLPTSVAPFLKGLDADVGIEGAAQIATPYVIDSGRLPSGTLALKIPHGSLVYDNPKYGKYRINNVSLACKLLFNGERPAESSLYVSDLTLRDSNTSLVMRGVVHDIGSDPDVSVNVEGNTSMRELASMISYLRGLNPTGEVRTEMGLKFRLSDIRNGHLDNVKVSGTLNLNNLDLGLPNHGGRLVAKNLNMDMNADAEDLTRCTVSDPWFKFGMTAAGFRFTDAGYDVSASDLTMKVSAHDDGLAALTRLRELMPYDMLLNAGKVAFRTPGDTASVEMENLAVSGRLTTRRHNRARMENFKFVSKGKKVTMRHGQTTVSVDKPVATLSGIHSDKTIATADYVRKNSWESDTTTDPKIYTTPRVLEVKAPRKMRDLMAHWRMAMHITGDGGTLLTPAYPVVNHLTGIDVDANFDSVRVRRMGMRSQKSSGHISGSISNVRQFLLSRTPAPLKFRFFADFDTIQLNQLCGAYKHGVGLTKGAGAFDRMLHDTLMTRTDSTAVLVPRNLNVHVGVNIKQIQYGNINYNDCKGELRTLDGNFRLNNVTVNTNFVDFAGHLMYNTSDIERMNAFLHLDLDHLDVTKFFYYFHTMSLMVPQLTNIKGMLDINTDIGCNIYPTMYAMIPSARGSVHLAGHDVSVRQTPEMHSKTRLFLPDGPIRIGDIDAKVTLRDNMVHIYPFNVDVDKYKLRVEGLNSLNGRMYYHVAVRHWSLDIPFGLNVKGSFQHPVIKVGGEAWHSDYGTEVANDISTGAELNILYKAKRIILEFIQKAAEYDKTPASEYLTFGK